MANCSRVLAKSSFYVNRKPLHIRLLRHGTVLTGGARFEEFLIDALENELIHNSFGVKKDKVVFARLFHGIQNVFLIAKGFFNSNANTNIVPARLALSSIARNWFSKKKTVIVLHNFDNTDGKSIFLNYYFKVLFSILKSNPKRVCIVCVSPFFQQFFQKEFSNLPVFHVPNLFQTGQYRNYGTAKNEKKILLGQYSLKNDISIYDLAKKLSKNGFECFFLSLNPKETGKFEDYEIKYVSFDEYLNEMATSYCSLAFSGVDEGWPRMVHESILVGTPVIGYARGGLGDLLRESDSYIVRSVDETFDLIVSRKIELKVSDDFIKRYDVSKAPMYLGPLMKFICRDV